MLLLALLLQAGLVPADLEKMRQAIPACLEDTYLKAIDALPEADRRQAEIVCLAFTLGEDHARAAKPDDISQRDWQAWQLRQIDQTLEGLKQVGKDVRETNKALDIPRR